MKNGWKKNRDIPSQFFFPRLIHLDDGLKPGLKFFQSFQTGLEHRLKLRDSVRCFLVDPLDRLFSVSDQRLLKLCRDVRSHLRDIFLPVFLAFRLYPALIGKSSGCLFQQRDGYVGRHGVSWTSGGCYFVISCFLSSDVNSSRRNFTLSNTVSSVEERSVMVFIIAW